MDAVAFSPGNVVLAAKFDFMVLGSIEPFSTLSRNRFSKPSLGWFESDKEVDSTLSSEVFTEKQQSLLFRPRIAH
jgi:hypothetical protein